MRGLVVSLWDFWFDRLLALRTRSPGGVRSRLARGRVGSVRQGLGKGGAHRLATHFTGDGNVMVPNSPVMTGKDAIGKAMKAPLPDPNLSLALQPVQVEVSRGGRHAYTRGGLYAHGGGSRESAGGDGKAQGCHEFQQGDRWSTGIL